jgi:hypothetical protein
LLPLLVQTRPLLLLLALATATIAAICPARCAYDDVPLPLRTGLMLVMSLLLLLPAAGLQLLRKGTMLDAVPPAAVPAAANSAPPAGAMLAAAAVMGAAAASTVLL